MVAKNTITCIYIAWLGLISFHFQVTLDTATSFVIGWPITNAVITFRYVWGSNFSPYMA